MIIKSVEVNFSHDDNNYCAILCNDKCGGIYMMVGTHGRQFLIRNANKEDVIEFLIGARIDITNPRD